MAVPLALLSFLRAGGLGKVGTFINGTMAAGEVISDLGKLAKSTLKAVSGNWLEVNDAAFKTARTMAFGRQQAIAYNKELLASTRQLAAQFGVTAQELAEFQKSYAEAVGRNIILTREQQAHMAALSKITDSATASRLVDEFDKVGIGIARATAYTGRLQERAKALGVSPAKATKMMADNIKLAASYSFRNGVNDIEKMALKATSLRMDMNAIMQATEKFADVESAISTAANIQMLGGDFAREFSNPMGAMFEAQADPMAFQRRIERLISGKGTYDSKTGAVTFDPITMRMMREAAKQLGMSAEQLNNSAMASVQNQKVEEELRAAGNFGKWSDVQLEAIKNLSRTNVDVETGKHFVTYLEDGKAKQAFLEDLTEKQLALAQDSQMSEEGLWNDVADIKTILERVHGRARETKSTKEDIQGAREWFNTALASLSDFALRPLANLLNKATGIKSFAQGGIVEPVKAQMGAIIPGDSYSGDKTPVMANSGEMILNQGQQKSMFSLISSLALNGGALYGLSKLGGRIGIGGLGSTMLMANMLGGKDAGMKEMIEAHFINKFLLKGLNPLKASIKGIGSVSTEAAKSTGVLSSDISKAGKAVNSFSKVLYSPFEKVGNKLRSSSWGKSVTEYVDKLKERISQKTTVEQTTPAKEAVKNRRPNKGNGPGGKRGRTLDKVISDNAKRKGITKASKQSATAISNTSKTAAKAAEASTKIAKTAGTIGKVAKATARFAGPLGTVLTVGSAAVEGFQAKKEYNKKLDQIKNSQMSGKEKAIAKDKAIKEKNQAYGAAAGSAVGTVAGAALGSLLGPLGTMAGMWLGGMAGKWIGKGIGGLFGGNNTKQYEKPIAKAANGLVVPGNSPTGDKVHVMANSGEMILNQGQQNKLFTAINSLEQGNSTSIKALPEPGKFLKVSPPATTSVGTKTIGVGKTSIDLNVSGTIKLEGGGKYVDFDLGRLLDTPEFKRQLTDIIAKRLNENSNSGKRNMESERNNMASQYNKSGK